MVNSIAQELQGRTGDDAQLLLLRSRLQGLKPKPVVEAQDLIAQVEQTDEFIGYSSRSIVEGIDMDVGLKMEAAHAIGQAREHARAAEAEQARGH